MFHYRWAYDADACKAAKILPRWGKIHGNEQTAKGMGLLFRERQVSRLYVVGSNKITKPIIENSYHRFLEVMNDLIAKQPFFMGHRPGSGDFALFGQLTQLASFDPTPMALTLEVSPRTYVWTDLLEDQSGTEVTEEDWMPSSAYANLRPFFERNGANLCPLHAR